MFWLRLIKESLRAAWYELWTHKLRTMLSLLGITIGIFAIISVLSAVDSIEQKVRDSVDQLGSNVIFIQKWPWSFGGDYPWWKYLRRPVPTYDEFREIQDKARLAEAITLFINVGDKTIRYRDQQIDKVEIQGITYDHDRIFHLNLTKGRYFSMTEMQRGANMAILGGNVAERLFGDDINPLLRNIQLMGRKFRIIGVLETQGEDLISFGTDDNVFVPYLAAQKLINPETDRVSPTIAVKGTETVPLEEVGYELAGIMRVVRKLHPRDEENFALNRVSLIANQVTSTFRIINLAGWLIGGFAMLVGGFGIANIMFVSVRERTNIIGIKKAIGAKNYVIMLEFLLEAIMLCLIGGTAGLAGVFGAFVVLNAVFDFGLVLSWQNMMLGTWVSILIGIIAGFWPAFTASRMDPVHAIRFQ